jgi:hypothetical protein
VTKVRVSTPAPGYAAGTKVSVEKSKAELDGLLGKHGAGSRGIMHDEARAVAAVIFVLEGRKYRIEVPMPTPSDVDAAWKKKQPPGAWKWGYTQVEKWKRERLEQLARERWRGLVLLVKAKLEIVRMGVSSFEREFLADLLLPNGETAHQTIGTYMKKLLANGYEGPLALPERTE